MKEAPFARLEDVIRDPLFPELDVALRQGRHIDRDEADRYAFLLDAQTHLEIFYRRYGCELMHASDGYFYLLPRGDQLGRRHLTAGEMLVGQVLALMYLEPSAVQAGGAVGPRRPRSMTKRPRTNHESNPGHTACARQLAWRVLRALLARSECHSARGRERRWQDDGPDRRLPRTLTRHVAAPVHERR